MKTWLSAVFLVLALVAPSAFAGNPGDGGTSGDTQDPAEELQEEIRKFQEAIIPLNQMNPLSTDFQKKGPLGSTGRFDGQAQYPQLQKLLADRRVQSLLKLFSDSHFSRDVDRLISHPQRVYIAYGELALMIFMFIFRTWRFSKCQGLFGRLWVSSYTGVLFLVGSCFGVPYAVFGQPYADLVRRVVATVVSG